MAHKPLLHLMLVYYAFHFSFGFVTCLQYDTNISSTTASTTPATTLATTAITITKAPLTSSKAPQVKIITARATPTLFSTSIPSIIITMTFTLPWKTFCPLSEKFRRKLAANLIEQNEDKSVHLVSAARIRYVNVDGHCTKPSSYAEEKAVVELYVSEKEDFWMVDEVITIKAYRFLHDCVTNRKMSKIDAIFANKVKDVGLRGSKASNHRKGTGISEFQRVAIGIGVALIVVFLAVLIYRRKKASIPILTKRKQAQVNELSSYELEVLCPTEQT